MKSSSHIAREKRRLYKNKIIREYNKIFQESKDTQLIPERIIRLLANYLWKKEFQLLLDIFRRIDSRYRRTSEYYFTLGIIYLAEAKWLAIIGDNINFDCKRSIELINKAINVHPDRLEYYAQLSNAFALLGDYTKSIDIVKSQLLPLYEKITEKGGRIAILNYFPTLHRIANFHDALEYSRQALYYLRKGNIDEALIFVDKTKKLDNWHCLANCIAGLIDAERKDFNKALYHFDICIKVEPNWAESYYKKGLVLYNKNEIVHAIKYLRKAIYLAKKYYKKKSKRYIYSMIISYYYIRGMWHWKNGKINTAYRNFIKLVNTVKHNKMKNWYDLCILPNVLRIDKKIYAFSATETLVSLSRKVNRTCIDYANSFCRSPKFRKAGYVFYDIMNTKQPFLCSLLSALDDPFRHKYVSRLKQINKEYNLKIDTDEIDEYILLVRFLKFPENQLNQRGFFRGVQSVNALKNFILEVRNEIGKYVSLNKIPRYKQRQLIKSLNPFSSIMGGESSCFFTDKFLTEKYFTKSMQLFETFVSKKLKIQNRILKGESEKVTGMIKRDIQKTVNKILKEKEKDVKELTGISSQPYNQKKIKNLTKYFMEFKETKVNIYLYTKKGQTELFKGKRNQQPYQLLEYFLIKENHRVHWVEAIKILKRWQKTRETIYNLKENFRNTVTDLRTEFKSKDLSIEIEPQGNGWWQLKSDVDSNILEAQKLVKDIQNKLKEKKHDEKVKQNLLKALELYDGCVEAAMLVLILRDKIKFDNKIINRVRKMLIRRKSALEIQIKPTLKDYVKNPEKIGWPKDKDTEETEFNEEIQLLLYDINYEIKQLNQSLQGLPKVYDKEYEEIRIFIQENNYDELLKKKSIGKLINKILNELRKRQKYRSYGMIWQWFGGYEDAVIKQYVEAWLCKAIGKNKQNINFVVAWRKGIFVEYLFNITINEIRNLVYQETLQLPPRAINDRNKAIQYINEIVGENDGIMPRRDRLRMLLCAKTDRTVEYSDYLICLYYKGMEEHLHENIIQESSQEKTTKKE